jgi:hypothetical protein
MVTSASGEAGREDLDGPHDLKRTEPEDPISTQVFEVNALVFVPLFLSKYVGSTQMISRPFSIGHWEACG